MDIRYQEELRQYLDRVETLKDVMNQACSLIFSTYCSKLTQGRLEALPEFENSIRNNPIELLKAIKNCMVESVRAQHPLISMMDSLIRLANIKMCNQESPLEHVKQFKEYRDVMVSHLGKDLLDYHTTQTQAYKDALHVADSAAKKKLKDGAWDTWMAYLMMKGSDYPRYGSLLQGFGAQFSLEVDQCPKDLITATDIMSNHKLDPKHFENREAQKKAYNKQQHEKKDSPAETETSFAQPEADCYACGRKATWHATVQETQQACRLVCKQSHDCYEEEHGTSRTPPSQ